MTQMELRDSLQTMVEEFRLEGEENRNKRHQEVCSICEFYDDYIGMCNYYTHTGELRKCSGSKCVEKKIFRKATKKKKKPAPIS